MTQPPLIPDCPHTLSTADQARAGGWLGKTIRRRDGKWGPPIRVTAIGEQVILGVPVWETGESDEHHLCLTCCEWEVEG